MSESDWLDELTNNNWSVAMERYTASYPPDTAEEMIDELEQAIRQHIEREKREVIEKDLEIMKDYAHKVFMCDVLHGGYNADEKDIYDALKRYEAREDLREDFAKFFEEAQLQKDTDNE